MCMSSTLVAPKRSASRTLYAVAALSQPGSESASATTSA